jgi:hypothetical protein
VYIQCQQFPKIKEFLMPQFDWSQYANPNTAPWFYQVAPYLLPIMIRAALQGQTMTYGQLAQALEDEYGLEQKARKTLYGGAIGVVGFALEDLQKTLGEKIPPINALVVNASTKLPGKGVDNFVRHYLGIHKRNQSDQERSALMYAAQEHVFAYPHWHRIAAYFGTQAIAPDPTTPAQGPIDLPAMPKHAGAVESESHKALKRHIAHNPHLVRAYGKFPRGTNEHPLRSGDRLDVFFQASNTMLAVEVKPQNAPEAEIIRGIFQTVKYRAVLKAEQLVAGTPPTAQAVLALSSKPSLKIRQIADRLAVHVIVVPL